MNTTKKLIAIGLIVQILSVNSGFSDTIEVPIASADCPQYTESGTSCSSCVWVPEKCLVQIGDAVVSNAAESEVDKQTKDSSNCASTPKDHVHSNEKSEQFTWGFEVGGGVEGEGGGWYGAVHYSVKAKFEAKYGSETSVTKTIGAKIEQQVPPCSAIKSYVGYRIMKDEKSKVMGDRTCFYEAPDCNYSVVLGDYICKSPNTREGGEDSGEWIATADLHNEIVSKDHSDEYTPECEGGPCCQEGEDPPGPPNWYQSDLEQA